ncbi:MAG: hypothetical protein ACK5GN_12990 [Pseudomonadota bacterium]
MPVKLARLLLDITIGCCFDSHPRIDSVLQNSGFRHGLLENAIERLILHFYDHFFAHSYGEIFFWRSAIGCAPSCCVRHRNK